MTEARRRQAVVSMATDPAFAERVRAEPGSVAREFGLDAEDMAVLESLREDSGSAGASVLDPRLSRSALFFGGGQHLAAGHTDSGLLCDGHLAGFECDEQPAGLPCNALIHDADTTSGVHDGSLLTSAPSPEVRPETVDQTAAGAGEFDGGDKSDTASKPPGP